MAGSKNVQTFASAQIFYSAGSTGLQILQQIFIADTSDLLNRAFFSTLPDLPFLVTVWTGAPIAKSLLSHTTWRWGYGLWTIVLPVAFLPLALALILNMRRAARLQLLPQPPWRGQTLLGGLKSVWYELDVMGLLLLSAAIALILIPITLVATAKGGWHNASIIAMVVVGCLCFVVFPMWEMSRTLAPKPFLSLQLMGNRTVLAGCAIGFFYFGKYSPTNQGFSSANGQSCFLHLDPTILLFLPASCSKRIYRGCRSCYSILYVHLHCDRHLRVRLDQVYEALQILYNSRSVHLPFRRWTNDPIPGRGQHDSTNCRNANRSRDRRWYAQCPSAAGCPGLR